MVQEFWRWDADWQPDYLLRRVRQECSAYYLGKKGDKLVSWCEWRLILAEALESWAEQVEKEKREETEKGQEEEASKQSEEKRSVLFEKKLLLIQQQLSASSEYAHQSLLKHESMSSLRRQVSNFHKVRLCKQLGHGQVAITWSGYLSLALMRMSYFICSEKQFNCEAQLDKF